MNNVKLIYNDIFCHSLSKLTFSGRHIDLFLTFIAMYNINFHFNKKFTYIIYYFLINEGIIENAKKTFICVVGA